MSKISILILIICISNIIPTFSNTDECHGIKLFISGDVHLAMPLLLQQFKRAPNSLYVVSEYIAAGYSMTAKRMSILPREPNIIEQERKALKAAVFYFERAAQIKSKHLVGAEHSCTEFASPMSQILRAHGDAFNHLHLPDKAMQVFTSPAAKLLWNNPLCRPSQQSKVNYMDEHTEYIFDSDDYRASFSHIEKPVLKHLLPLLRNPLIINNEDLWTIHKEGLFVGKHNGWKTIVFWANGVLDRRACVQHLDIFAGVCSIIKYMMKTIPDFSTKTGQIKLSKMEPGTTIRPHAGQTNERLRMHCSVDVPKHDSILSRNSDSRKSKSGMGIRVGTVWRSWKKTNASDLKNDDDLNACFVFREECEHEVIVEDDVTRARTILIIDFVNPFLEENVDRVNESRIDL